MTPLFLQYPACSTCQKAKKWLTENNIEYTNRNYSANRIQSGWSATILE